MKTLVLWAALVSPLMGLEVPEKSRTGDMVSVVHAPKSFLKIVPDRSDKQRVEVSDTVTLFTGLPGSYTIQEVYLDGDKWVENNATCVIGDMGPEPPDPPGPLPPDPEPPGPGPSPGPIRVLVLHEATGGNYTREQLFALESKAARKYLMDHCSKTDGKPDFRFLDDDYTDEQFADDPSWLAGYKRAKLDSRGKSPWVMIFLANQTISVPMPDGEAAWLSLLKQYGGE